MTTPRTTEARDILLAAIRDLADQGYSQTIVGEQLGLSREAVSGLSTRADPPIRFSAKKGRPQQSVSPQQQKQRLTRAGRPVTCCWTGCEDPPISFGKPYCRKHTRGEI